MNKNYVFLLLIVIVFLSQKVHTQEKFKSGFIVNIKNDTVYGYINDKVDYKLIINIEFKKELSDSLTKLTTDDIRGFQFESGRRFERIYKKNNNSYVFGKKYIQGKIDLFTVSRLKNEKLEYYLQNNEINESVYLTPPVKTEITKDGKKYVGKTNATFNGKMKAIKGDSSDYKEIKYKQKSIKKSIIDYNNKFENDYPVNLFNENILTTYDISLGFGIWGPFTPGNGNYRINVAMNIMNRDKNRKISYYSAINYSQFTEEYHVNLEPSSTYEDTFYTFRIIPIGLKIQADKEKVIPYWFAGAGLGFYYMTNGYEDNDDTRLFPSIVLGAGMKFKVGINYIFTELTLNGGMYLNFGYSF